MKVGFIKPSFPFEKRVALLPENIMDFPNELLIEENFGSNLGISDDEYRAKNCAIETRDKIFRTCDAIFCLKLLQPDDYPLVREKQLIVGWTHPTGSGTDFFKNIAQPRNILIADLDNIYPTLFYQDRKIPIPWIPRDFIRENSVMAGTASTLHALLNYGLYPDSHTKVAILAPGNVSQGAYQVMAKFNCFIRLFYRKTMNEFYESIGEYDIIINGIEVDEPGKHIITRENLKKVKQKALIIDVAADAGNAIEGSHYTNIGDPIYEENSIAFYEVNNSPSILYRTASKIISRQFSKHIYSHDFIEYFRLIDPR